LQNQFRFFPSHLIHVPVGIGARPGSSQVLRIFWLLKKTAQRAARMTAGADYYSDARNAPRARGLRGIRELRGARRIVGRAGLAVVNWPVRRFGGWPHPLAACAAAAAVPGAVELAPLAASVA